MKFSHNWLEELSGVRMKAEKMAELLSLHSFEVESVEKSGNDFILDIDILANRSGEGYGHICVARELSVLKNKKFKLPSLPLKESTEPIKDHVSIKVKNSKLCPRYMARAIVGIRVSDSPVWLKKRLQALGMNSINNIVDATNYVMLEMGQPLHAFDSDKVKNRQIIVRASKKGERVTTLDNQRMELPSDVLLITDPDKILAIAGIKGATGAEISGKTKNIILESANFEGSNIRKTSKEINLATDASARFAQNLSPALAEIALDRVAALIKKIAGGKILDGKVDVYPKKLVPRRIYLESERINGLLGMKVSEKEAIRILSLLGFEAKKTNLYSKVGEVIDLARTFVGRKYKYGASTTFDAPNYFDCSSFVKYLYRQIGFELPRISIEQSQIGKKINPKDLQAGDLIFTVGSRPHFNSSAKNGVGHVAMYIGGNKVIHASGSAKKVLISPVKPMMAKSQFRAIRRPIDEKYDKDGLEVTAPLNRLDVEQDADLIEEIGRIIGLYKIKPIAPETKFLPVEIPENLQWQDKFRHALVSLGFSEVYNYAFIGEKDVEIFGLKPEKLINLRNPMSEEIKYLRPSLLINLLRNAASNLRFFSQFMVFEIGNMYQWGLSSGKTDMWENEKPMLAGLIVSLKKPDEIFYELKGILDAVFEKFGLTDVWHDSAKPTPEDSKLSWWSQNQISEIKSGNAEIGFMGILNQKVLNGLGIKQNVAAFEFDLFKLIDSAKADKKYQELPKFPSVVRDISLLLPDSTRVEEVLNVIELAGGELLEDTDLLDIYEGEEMPHGQISMAFRLVFRSGKKTLSESEISALMGKIETAVKKQGWQIR